jgi:hypothetical protein
VEVDLGIQGSSTQPDPALISNSTQLVITRSITARKSPQAISQLVAGIFQEYFATTKNNLGALVSTTELSNQILQLGDIEKIETVTTIDNDTYTVPGISLIAYNPIYPYNDFSVIGQDTQLPYFKFPYLKDSANFINKITVTTPSIQTLT